VVIWTIAHVAHGGVHTVMQFTIARFGLGIGESGNFPAGVKAVADWFPAKERAFAIGLFNAGSNVGAILTPLLIWAMVPAIGWRMTFVVTGIFGVAWLIAWLAIFRDSPHGHEKVSEAELAHITQDPADPAVKVKNLWGKLVLRKETWAFALGKFFIDPIWWFYLFWLPSYIGKQYGLNLTSWDTPTAALALAAIYLISDAGSVAGGWLSGRFMNAGMSVNKARKLTMLIAACFVLPVMFATTFHNLWLSVFVIGVAAIACSRPMSARGLFPRAGAVRPGQGPADHQPARPHRPGVVRHQRPVRGRHRPAAGPDHYLFRMLYSQGISLDAEGALEGRRAGTDPRAAWRLLRPRTSTCSAAPRRGCG
jgi:ACS family hexuronate transporter-like MFS transporter